MLDKNTTYYAVFSSDGLSGSVVDRSVRYAGGNPYAGGTFLYMSNPQLSLDANFTATFAPAIPEPSTYAAIAAAVALVAAAGRKMTSRRRISDSMAERASSTPV